MTRKGFTGISADDELEVTLPLAARQLFGGASDLQKYWQRPSARWLQAAGRLKPGATLEQARAQLDALWPAIRQEMAPTDKTLAELGRFRDLQLKAESGAKGGSLLRRRFASRFTLCWPFLAGASAGVRQSGELDAGARGVPQPRVWSALERIAIPFANSNSPWRTGKGAVSGAAGRPAEIL